jgi:hypothetical protein
MSSKEFIEYANKLSTKIITEISPSDISFVDNAVKKYPRMSDFFDDDLRVDDPRETNNATHLLSALRMRTVPASAVSDIVGINGLILLLSITKDEKLKRDMVVYLKSLGISTVNFVIDRYFPSI